MNGQGLTKIREKMSLKVLLSMFIILWGYVIDAKYEAVTREYGPITGATEPQHTGSWIFKKDPLLSLSQLQMMMNSNCFSRMSSNSSQDKVIIFNSTLKPHVVLNFREELLTLGKHTENLCLYTESESTFEATLDLSCIQYMYNLKRLWLTFHAKPSVSSDMFLSTLKYVRNVTIPYLPMEELYIDIPLHNMAALQALVTHATNLKVLKVGTAHYHKTEIPSFISSLSNAPLEALSFHDFRCTSEKCEPINIEAMEALISHKLQYLDLSKNEISGIPSGYLINMDKLKYLDVSQNIFTANLALRLLIEIAFHDTLEVYKMGNLHLTEHNDQLRTKRTTETSLKYCMKKFKISNIFSPKLADNSTFCKISDCIQADGGYGSTVKLHCKAVASHKELISLLNFKCSPPFNFPILKSMKDLDLSGMVGKTSIRGERANIGRIRTICFQNVTMEKLRFAWNRDFSRRINLETYFSNVKFSGLTVKSFDIRYNDMTLILSNKTKIFSSMQMTKLFLSGNTIIFSGNYDFCKDYNLIEEVDLSTTGLVTIPRTAFYNCSKIHTINLSNNRLTAIDLSLGQNNQLHLLNLSNNQIHTLHNTLTRGLLGLASNTPLTVDLNGNIFHCDCTKDGINTIRFIQANHEEMTLKDNEKLLCLADIDGQASFKDIKGIDMNNMMENCYKNHTKEIVLVIVVNLCLSLLIVSIIVLYKYRYRIKTWYFHKIHLKSSRRQRNNISNALLDDDYSMDNLEDGQQVLRVEDKYDAFISYCAEDRFWVHNVLVKELEDKYGFQLCIHYRDFLAGRPIADEIVKNLKLSRVVIVVLSENALRSNWMKYELDVAHTNSLNYGKKLLILKLGSLPRNLLNGVAQQIVDSRVYVEWPELDYEPERYIPENDQDSSSEEREKRMKEQFWYKVTLTLYNYSESNHCISCFLCCKTRQVITNE